MGAAGELKRPARGYDPTAGSHLIIILRRAPDRPWGATLLKERGETTVIQAMRVGDLFQHRKRLWLRLDSCFLLSGYQGSVMSGPVLNSMRRGLDGQSRTP